MGLNASPGKVGLALGSGAARGLAHIGVLVALEREGIPIDMIAGTSAGAAVGALYAQGKQASQIKEIALNIGWRQIVTMMDPTLPRSGFFGGRRITAMLRSIIGDASFSELKIPLACVATDIITGEEVVLSSGSVTEAVRASISIPVIFTTIKKQGRYMVDGGLVNPVPVNTVRGMGATRTIAVNVIPDTADRIKRTSGYKEPNIFNVLTQSIYITTYSLVKQSLAEADIVIRPDLELMGYGDFHRAAYCIERGEQATQALMPEIKRLLYGRAA